MGGFLLLGLAFFLVLFGGQWFGSGGEGEEAPNQAPADQPEDSSILEQVPAFATAENSRSPLPSGSGPLLVGDQAYDFSLSDLDGNSYSLSGLAGQPVIINFWATWCGPCRIEMPELQATFERYQADGLIILAIDQQESPDVVRAFFHDEMELTFTPLLDPEGQVAQLYGVSNFPTTFFVNSAGLITALHRGPMVKSQIDGYLAATDPILFPLPGG